VAAAPDTLRTIQRPSCFNTDVACPELSGRAGLRCLLGRRAIGLPTEHVDRVIEAACARFNHRSGHCSWRTPWRFKGSSASIFISVRLVIARCQVDYAGRLTAHLPMAKRLILIKSDGSVSIHADDRAYKPLNWMSPPCSLVELEAPAPEHHSAPVAEPLTALWEVRGREGDTLQIWLAEVYHDSSYELGVDPGLQKDGVEAHLQALLAEHPEALAPGLSLVRREHPTPIGPVDLLCRDSAGAYVAVEIKRRGEIDGVEQLSRYLDLMRRDTLLGTVHGILAAQLIKPQARVLANDRGISCVTVDYDMLRGLDSAEDRLF
jgi:RecB family endonuclease NucS